MSSNENTASQEDNKNDCVVYGNLGKCAASFETAERVV